MLLRREMVDRGVLTRNAEGSAYRLVQSLENGDVDEMDFKKEMKLKAKEEKPSYGIFQIKNVKNGKLFVNSTPNFKTLNGLKFMLTTGGHKNKELQTDWDEHGKENFEIEILETIDEKDWQGTSKGKILEKQLDKWLEELQPYGEKGYNRIKKSVIDRWKRRQTHNCVCRLFHVYLFGVSFSGFLIGTRLKIS